MIEAVTIGNLVAVIALAISIIRIFFNTGKYVEKVDELKRDQTAIARNIEKVVENFTEMEKRFIGLLDSLSKGLVTQEELKTMMKFYDGSQHRTDENIKEIWHRIDELVKTKQDKYDCQARMHK